MNGESVSCKVLITMKKTCIKCMEEKEGTEFSTKQSKCKVCQSLYNKEYRSKNKEKLLSLKREYRILNKEKVLESSKVHYYLNRDKMLAKSKVYRLLNKEKTNTAINRWREANPEKVKKIKRAWTLRNPHKVNAITYKRRASKLKATVIWANTFFIEEIYDLAEKRSKITGVDWQVDHIVPLRSKLVCGLHWEGNLQVIPAKENASKGNRYWPDMPDKEIEICHQS